MDFGPSCDEVTDKWLAPPTLDNHETAHNTQGHGSQVLDEDSPRLPSIWWHLA